MSAATVAALYVEANGVYANLPGVEVWDEARDARLYPGPWPVVAHPPCNRWSIMAQCRQQRDGKDGGCFEAALAAVERFGGVLEQPAHTLAWRAFQLPRPATRGWNRSLFRPGWAATVDQRHYGHEVNKPTWLYYVGDEPPALAWGAAARTSRRVGRAFGGSVDGMRRARTPVAFRDLLLAMARESVAVAA